MAVQDPGADGPVIQAASTRALSAGTTLDAVLAMLAGVAPSLRAPVLIFTYYNPIMARGLDRFCQQVKDAGVSGELRPAIHCHALQAQARSLWLNRAEMLHAAVRFALQCPPCAMRQTCNRQEGFRPDPFQEPHGMPCTRVEVESSVPAASDPVSWVACAGLCSPAGS